jgi:hypothetical protein
VYCPLIPIDGTCLPGEPRQECLVLEVASVLLELDADERITCPEQ